MLESYIALEKLRFGSRLSLHFEKTGIGNGSTRIPPLILLAFVENSFKHGMSRITGDGLINISLLVKPGELLFQIDNPIWSDHPGRAEKNGIGLQNVVRRLELLYGPRYHLHLSETVDHFHVSLKIPLA